MELTPSEEHFGKQHEDRKPPTYDGNWSNLQNHITEVHSPSLPSRSHSQAPIRFPKIKGYLVISSASHSPTKAMQSPSHAVSPCDYCHNPTLEPLHAWFSSSLPLFSLPNLPHNLPNPILNPLPNPPPIRIPDPPNHTLNLPIPPILRHLRDAHRHCPSFHFRL